jgi:hypothetical protein
LPSGLPRRLNKYLTNYKFGNDLFCRAWERAWKQEQKCLEAKSHKTGEPDTAYRKSIRPTLPAGQFWGLPSLEAVSGVTVSARLRAPAERERFYLEIPTPLAHQRASIGKKATEIAKVI